MHSGGYKKLSDFFFFGRNSKNIYALIFLNCLVQSFFERRPNFEAFRENNLKTVFYKIFPFKLNLTFWFLTYWLISKIGGENLKGKFNYFFSLKCSTIIFFFFFFSSVIGFCLGESAYCA